jgi:translation initiation factor IF-3
VDQRGGDAIAERLRKNEEIRGRTVRLIGPEGDQLGIMLVEQARLKAAELQLDLVEVAPKANPPVCRVMDYGKHLYQEQKKEQHAHKKAHAHDLKEVRLRPRIGKHDLEIKVARAKGFLAEGHRVQFTMVYRGLEFKHQDIGEQILKSVVVTLGETCKVERGPFREGRRVGLILAPRPGGARAAEKPAQQEAAAARL